MRLLPGLLLLAALGGLARADEGTTTRVDIHARPWAEVWVDGKKIAEETPVRGLALTAGSHHFLFTNHISAPIERDLVIAPGGPQTLMVDMQERALHLEPGGAPLLPAESEFIPVPELPRLPTSGRLSVVTQPPCEVWVNGVKIGDSPIDELALDAGPHRLRLVNLKQGFVAERPVTIEPGKTLRVELDLVDQTISPPEAKLPAAFETPPPPPDDPWGPDTPDDWTQ